MGDTRSLHAGTWIVATITFALTYWFIDYKLWPWMIETLCREILKCQ